MKNRVLLRLLLLFAALTGVSEKIAAQVNTDQVMIIGQNALYFEDYVLSIQYFNQAINAKPYLARPYFLRAIAKLNLEDFAGAEADASLAIDRNPFITDAYEVRGVARQNQGKYRLAIDDYDLALAQLPGNKSLLFNKAMVQQETGRYDEAASTFQELLDAYPRFDKAYMGRARLLLLTGDTISARNDIDRALELNPDAATAWLLHADIAMSADKDFATALNDLNHAIALEPKHAPLYINRAYIRYRLDDLYGAFADYDYALQLDPGSSTAYFNRAVVRAELRDTNLAIDDLSKAIALDPDDYKAIFNRAILLRDIGDLDNALADINRIIETFPDFAAAWYVRYEIKAVKLDPTAERDRRRSLDLAARSKATLPVQFDPDAVNSPSPDAPQQVDQEVARRQFGSLVRVDSDLASDLTSYNNKDIKGRVQDRNVNIRPEPIFTLTYYTPSTTLRPSGEYIREVADLNDLHLLPMALQVSNQSADATTDDSMFATHRFNINVANERIASASTPRPIDYFGRAMDYLTLRDYANAEADLSEAIRLSEDFTLAYLARFAARYYAWISKSDSKEGTLLPGAIEFTAVKADIEKVTRLSPGMAIAWFDKGVVELQIGDNEGAIASFDRAIELRPDFGEAYYNRGYARLQSGHRQKGMADLSHAGQLGVVGAYNVIKRLSR